MEFVANNARISRHRIGAISLAVVVLSTLIEETPRHHCVRDVRKKNAPVNTIQVSCNRVYQIRLDNFMKDRLYKIASHFNIMFVAKIFYLFMDRYFLKDTIHTYYN